MVPVLVGWRCSLLQGVQNKFLVGMSCKKKKINDVWHGKRNLFPQFFFVNPPFFPFLTLFPPHFWVWRGKKELKLLPGFLFHFSKQREKKRLFSPPPKFLKLMVFCQLGPSLFFFQWFPPSQSIFSFSFSLHLFFLSLSPFPNTIWLVQSNLPKWKNFFLHSGGIPTHPGKNYIFKKSQKCSI